jgi:hypothetical protein
MSEDLKSSESVFQVDVQGHDVRITGSGTKKKEKELASIHTAILFPKNLVKN